MGKNVFSLKAKSLFQKWKKGKSSTPISNTGVRSTRFFFKVVFHKELIPKVSVNEDSKKEVRISGLKILTNDYQ